MPGTYKNLTFADREQAPKFGFGSSTREKNYLGLHKLKKLGDLPGPGSYNIPNTVGKVAPYALPP